MPVLTFVSSVIAPDRRDDVVRIYTETVEGSALPPGLRETFLLAADDGTMAVASVWESREALDAMLASGEEPFARRLLREAGGTPDVRLFDVVGGASAEAA